MTGWPQVNDLVQLVREDGQRCSSRVEDSDESSLAVAAPLDDAWRAAAASDEVLELQWHSLRGLHTVPAGVNPSRRAGGLWWLHPTDQPRVHQRRSYARGNAPAVPVTLVWTGGQHHPGEGQLLDLGEGGARVHLPDPVAVRSGEAVRVVVDVEGRVVEVAGTVLREREVPVGTEVVVAFPELPDDAANQVRQLVFAWQRQSRR